MTHANTKTKQATTKHGNGQQNGKYLFHRLLPQISSTVSRIVAVFQYKIAELGNLERKSPQGFTVCAEFDWMLEFISLTRRNHTHAAQAQDGHKEECAEKNESHEAIKAP